MSRGRIGLLIPPLALGSLLLAGCFSSSPGLRAASSAEVAGGKLGSFEILSAGLTRGEIQPVRCDAGDLERFLGGDLVDELQRVAIRLAVDPLYGPAVRVYDLDEPFDHSVVFVREECEIFDMRLEPTGWIVNDVIVRNLDLEVDCENEDGAKIVGHARAKCD